MSMYILVSGVSHRFEHVLMTGRHILLSAFVLWYIDVIVAFTLHIQKHIFNKLDYIFLFKFAFEKISCDSLLSLPS